MTGGRAFHAEAEGAAGSGAPHAARPHPAPFPGRPATEEAGARLAPLARTAAPAQPLHSRDRPRPPAAQSLPERTPPEPRSSPATNKDRSTTATAMLPRRLQQRRANTEPAATTRVTTAAPGGDELQLGPSP